MFSSTTIPLSTNIPTPSARPPKETVLSVKPLKYISANVEITEIGMAKPMMNMPEKLRRKKSRTKTAKPAPMRAASLTLLIEARMKFAESQVLSIRTGSPSA